MGSRATAQGEPDKHPARIAGMFDRIAGRYDLLNHLLSGGLDLYWRARAIRALGLTGRERVLDVCAGTADVMIAALRATGRGARYAVGVDFAHEMLRVGHRKLAGAGLSRRAPLVRGDATGLPVAAGSVDAATIAFGIRNVVAPLEALTEIARCLRVGGRLAVLEFAMPTAPLLRSLYSWYFRQVLPRIGALVSRHDEAYRYLPESVGAFYAPAEFSGLLAAAGFVDIRAVPLSFGIVYLYVARTPAASAVRGRGEDPAAFGQAPRPPGPV
jgi:demethylmenaquinone methyltransferase/2-methoxy-6-polyprenyl-1,4-benzoquinol methylase